MKLFDAPGTRMYFCMNMPNLVCNYYHDQSGARIYIISVCTQKKAVVSGCGHIASYIEVVTCR